MASRSPTPRLTPIGSAINNSLNVLVANSVHGHFPFPFPSFVWPKITWSRACWKMKYSPPAPSLGLQVKCLLGQTRPDKLTCHFYQGDRQRRPRLAWGSQGGLAPCQKSGVQVIWQNYDKIWQNYDRDIHYYIGCFLTAPPPKKKSKSM